MSSPPVISTASFAARLGVALTLSLGLLLAGGLARAADQRAGDPFAPPDADPFAAKPGPHSPPAQDRERPAAAPQREGRPVAEVLSGPTFLEFVDTPLRDVVAYLSDLHHIPVVIDRRALQAAGLDEDSPLTANVRGVPLRSALNLMLEQAGLAYVVRDHCLVVTSEEQAAKSLVARTYSLAEIPLSGVPENQGVAGLIETIRCSVAPESWQGAGGRASIRAVVVRGVPQLVVSQTERAHSQIAELLDQLSRPAAATAPSESPALAARRREQEAAQRIEAALNQPTELHFENSPLRAVTAYIAERHELPIRIDGRALEEVGLGDDTPVTINATNISLRSALTWMLRDLDLTWMNQDEMLVITTPERAEELPTVKVYLVNDLANPGGVLPGPDFAWLIDVIEATVAPATWDTVGGPGSVEPMWVGKANVLVISQTREVHEQVADLLGQLREAVLAGETFPEWPTLREPIPRPKVKPQWRGMMGGGPAPPEESPPSGEEGGR